MERGKWEGVTRKREKRERGKRERRERVKKGVRTAKPSDYS